MTDFARRTLVVLDRLALCVQRMHVARTRQQGVQVMVIDQLAARSASGFVQASTRAVYACRSKTCCPSLR
ncbi:MAG: hypothetical protein RR775_22505 [Massilia sp.]|uniref:hypothetical protein n=1 Tax=Massilia sp. TaxID=1882437 RepID=UPI002FC639B5